MLRFSKIKKNSTFITYVHISSKPLKFDHLRSSFQISFFYDETKNFEN